MWSRWTTCDLYHKSAVYLFCMYLPYISVHIILPGYPAVLVEIPPSSWNTFFLNRNQSISQDKFQGFYSSMYRTYKLFKVCCLRNTLWGYRQFKWLVILSESFYRDVFKTNGSGGEVSVSTCANNPRGNDCLVRHWQIALLCLWDYHRTTSPCRLVSPFT